MVQKIFVKSGEYQFASQASPTLLVTERLGKDIAFSVYNPETHRVVLARMVSLEEISKIITSLISSSGSHIRLKVQFVGGQYKGKLNTDGSPKNDMSESTEYQYFQSAQNLFKSDHDIFSAEVFHKEHPDSVSVYPKTGLLKPYGDQEGSLRIYPGVTFPSTTAISPEKTSVSTKISSMNTH